VIYATMPAAAGRRREVQMMRSRHFGLLVLPMLMALVLASPALLEARSISIPFFGKQACKEEKERLGHEERILRDRQRLALDQCRASSGPGRGRCEDVERQQKTEQKRFKDRRKNTLDDCKNRGDARKDIRKHD
jgi:hypothetical protein